MQENKTELLLGEGFFGPSMAGKKIGDDPFLRKFVQEAVEKKQEQAETASYKIEVAFSWDRTERGPALALITIWESGRRLHGGGDEKMFWCGYQDCGKPVKSDAMMIDVGICPSCKRPLFRSMDDKILTVQQAKASRIPYADMEKRPCISEVKFAKLAVPRLADFLEKLWRDLDCDADLYVKFFRKKLKFEPGDKNAPDIMAKARMSRSYVVYTLKSILKDTSNGAVVRDRFESFLTA
jgi:hypothetical protein